MLTVIITLDDYEFEVMQFCSSRQFYCTCVKNSFIGLLDSLRNLSEPSLKAISIFYNTTSTWKKLLKEKEQKKNLWRKLLHKGKNIYGIFIKRIFWKKSNSLRSLLSFKFTSMNIMNPKNELVYSKSNLPCQTLQYKNGNAFTLLEELGSLFKFFGSVLTNLSNNQMESSHKLFIIILVILPEN